MKRTIGFGKIDFDGDMASILCLINDGTILDKSLFQDKED